MTDEEFNDYRHRVSEYSKQRWKDEKYRKHILESTIQKPGINRDSRVYMTKDKIEEWNKKKSINASGKNNPMYGKSSWDGLSKEER